MNLLGASPIKHQTTLQPASRNRSRTYNWPRLCGVPARADRDRTSRIGIGNPKIAEPASPFPADVDLETLWVTCHRAGLKQTEPMPEAAMKIACLEKISHEFQRLQRLLPCLRWKPVHQISMDENADEERCFTTVLIASRVRPLFMSLRIRLCAASSPPVRPHNRTLREARQGPGKTFSNRMFPTSELQSSAD